MRKTLGLCPNPHLRPFFEKKGLKNFQKAFKRIFCEVSSNRFMYHKYYLSKFPPSQTDDSWTFASNGWNSVADIGKEYGTYVLDEHEYYRMEMKYCEAILLICEHFKVNCLRIMRLEKFGFCGEKIAYPQELLSFYDSLVEGSLIDAENFSNICRLGLRENLWCFLYAQTVHFNLAFDYDYYISIVCEKIPDAIVQKILDLGLYLELAEA